LNPSETGDYRDVITPGELLYIPPIKSPARPDCYYIVQEGDNLESIARTAYGVKPWVMNPEKLWPLIFSDNREVFNKQGAKDPNTFFDVHPPQLLLITSWPESGTHHTMIRPLIHP
jgi:hypothetical protein